MMTLQEEKLFEESLKAYKLELLKIDLEVLPILIHPVIDPRTKLVMECYMNPDMEYPPPPVLLELVIDGTDIYPWKYKGSIAGQSGKQKSRKTMMMILEVIAYLTPGGIKSKDGRVVLRRPEGVPLGLIIFFDLEMPTYRVAKDIRERIKSACGENSKWFKIFYGMGRTKEEKRKLFDGALSLAKENGRDIDIAYVDGIRNLVADFNDVKESDEALELVKQMVRTIGCNVTCNIHQNKGDTNARGHLGAELVNASEMAIAISIQDDSKSRSIVKSEVNRDMNFPDLLIGHDDDHQPCLFGLYDAPSKEKRVTDTDKLLNEPAKFDDEVVKGLFKNRKELSAADTMSLLKVILKKRGKPCGRDAVKTYRDKLEHGGFIERKGEQQNNKAFYVTGHYYINQHL
jgi:hypothetical protein